MGLDDQVLLGVTGSGKTFTMANVIAKLNRPTLVLAHNKTLAAQLCSEFREFFPENAVEYFISYYDYYQPEAYIAHTDTYIEKDSAINDEIERLRHSATSSLAERRDVIVVSSVSCIYGLGDPIDYKNMVISLRTGQTRELGELMRRLTDIRYERNDMNFTRNTFRVRGDTLEIYPAYWAGRAIRVEFFGDEIDRISEIMHFAGVVAEEPGPRAPAADVRADDHRAAPAVEQTQESVVILEFEFIPVRHAAADGHPVDDGLPQRVIVGIEFDRRAEDAVTEYAAVIEPDGPRGAGSKGMK